VDTVAYDFMPVDLRAMNFNAGTIHFGRQDIAGLPFFGRHGILFFRRALRIISGIERTHCDNSAEIVSIIDDVVGNPA